MKHGCYPSREECKREFSATDDALTIWETFSLPMLSLNNTLYTEDESTIENLIPDKTDIEQEVTDNIFSQFRQQGLWDVVNKYCSDTEQEIIHEYFENCRSYAEIGKIVGLSGERVRQIIQNVCRKLKRGNSRNKLYSLVVGSEIDFNSGVARFTRTQTSSTERTALKRLEFYDFVKAELARRA